MNLEGVLLLSFFLSVPVAIIALAESGKPKGWKRSTYLILFFAILTIVVPVLLVLYITPKHSQQFELLDLVPDIALVVFAAAWGCLFGGLVFGRLQRSTQNPNGTIGN